jgi:hypothetical protein
VALDIIELVQIDPQSLRRHYASLSDEELLAIDETELTAVAQKYYDAEFAKRELASTQQAETLAEPEIAATPLELQGDWFSEAACACSFADLPGRSSAEHAADALAALQAARIPCQIEVREVDQPGEAARTYQEYRVMVPGALNLQATSVLDEEIFNSGLEAEWKSHLAALSDNDLRALNPDVICAGLRDRIERLSRAYNDEVKRRRQ